MQKFMFWILVLIGSPVAVNLLIMWQENMGYSKDVQGLTALAWITIMGIVLLKKKK